MYRQLSGGEGNVFFSPTSMHAAFSMLYKGARGDTADQLRDAFGFEPEDASRREAAAHLMASLNRDDHNHIHRERGATVAKIRSGPPVLFMIQDDESGTVLFMGKVSDP